MQEATRRAISARPIWERYPLALKATGRNAWLRQRTHLHAEQLQWRIVEQALADPDVRDAFFRTAPLPDGYAESFSERVVEYPWALTRLAPGIVLDAGSTFNHASVVGRFSGSKLIVVTLAPEGRSFVERGVSYLFADLRDLPLRDASVDQVMCISVLEHVGMDNRVYGDASPASGEPRVEAAAALAELMRIVRPGGRVLLSVPYGRRTDMGWQRQFDGSDVEHLLGAVSPSACEVAVYRRAGDGWQTSSLDAAADAAYGEGARAVVCADLVV
jgi:SAM-dependent methyltransferase